MPRDDSPSVGVVFVGHGTRDEQGTAEFFALGASLKGRFSPIPWANCFLELQNPDIPNGIKQLLSQGVRQIVVAPALLFAAKHAREDIPDLVRQATRFIEGVVTEQAEVLGCHPKVLEVADWRLRDVLEKGKGEKWGAGAKGKNSQSGGTQCLIVARGTSDVQAKQQIAQFVEARKSAIEQRLGKCTVSLAFVAAAEPRLKDALVDALASQPEHLVLLPHLLFHGEVLSEIRQLAEAAAVISPSTQVIVADHLAAGIISQTRSSDLLIDALQDRITTVLQKFLDSPTQFG